MNALPLRYFVSTGRFTILVLLASGAHTAPYTGVSKHMNYGTSLFIILTLTCCSQRTENLESPSNNSITVTDSTAQLSEPDEPELKIFPLPNLDSLLILVETSGMGENSPSKKYFNPTDSGIFVFYTLFNGAEYRRTNGATQMTYLGHLVTHTYRKARYGWSENDKDQTFILLASEVLNIGSVRIGSSLDELIRVLDSPLYETDSTFVFIDDKNTIGQFEIEDGKVKSYIYGRYNFPDSIGRMNESELIDFVKRKLK